jgi:hypothetical protein
MTLANYSPSGTTPVLPSSCYVKAPPRPQAQSSLVLEGMPILEMDLRVGAIAVVSPGPGTCPATAALTEEPIGSHPAKIGK